MPSTKQQDLGFTRDRLRDLGQTLPRLDAAVKQAAEAAERAKLEADLRPTDQAVRDAAQNAARKLDAAILERDTAAESVERLQRHEASLAAEVAAAAKVDVREAQRTFLAALATAIKVEAKAARRWAALALLDANLAGRQTGDVGLLMAEYLGGEYRHSAMNSDKSAGREVAALAASLRDRYERGEVLQ
jgi:hypothetical protein